MLEISSRSVPSAALLAANEQLLNLRAQYGDYSPGEEKDGHHSQIVAQEVCSMPCQIISDGTAAG
ncbi:MAG: hypothetical protein M5U34_16875 [Chloroflexi bacterium]|nr:hypothetical protein [Chloroflexota bacterium]